MFTSEIKLSLLEVMKELGIEVEEGEVKLEHPDEMEHGDYSTNIAMFVSSKFKVQSSKLENPRELAEEIKTKWEEIGLPDFAEKVEVAGPGFLNIWLRLESIGREIERLLNKSLVDGGGEEYEDVDLPRLRRGEAGGRKTIVIDYSSPNIAKPFGIGHLRSTNIGAAIYNLYKYLGWKTIGDNHLGDWGTQFGKLIYQIQTKVLNKGAQAVIPSEVMHRLVRHESRNPFLTDGGKGSLHYSRDDKKQLLLSLTIEDLEKLYVEFHQKAQSDPAMEEEAREWFKKLEEGDSEAREIWQACVDISLKEFNRVYDLLGVKIDYTYGESFYQDKMQAVLDDCKNRGILKESQGAQVIELEGMAVPAMLIKSDGATTYLLRDLATVKFRMSEFKPDLIVYEVGADQSFHFQQLFKICVLLGYAKMTNFVHVAHGLIRWPTGKFSTRKGDTIHLEEVLREAIERAKKISDKTKLNKNVIPTDRAGSEGVEESLSLDNEGKGSLDSARDDGIDEMKKNIDVSQAVGIGAIKYNDLKQNPRTDIIFDWDQILTLQGNSGPYLQYCYARTQSLLAKSEIRNSKLETDNPLSFRPKRSEVEGSLSLVGKNMRERDSFPAKPDRNDINNEEAILLRLLYRFPEVIESAAKEFSPNLLCNFLFNLAQKFNLFYDKYRIIRNTEDGIRKTDGRGQNETEPTEEQSRFRLFLTASVGEVLKQGLTLLGIEALEKM